MADYFEGAAGAERSRVHVSKFEGSFSTSHWHHENELLVCTAGTVTVMVEERTYSVPAGWCMFLLSGRAHQAEVSPDGEMLVALYDGSVCESTTGLCLAEPVFEDKYNAAHRLEAISEEAGAGRPFSNDYICACMSQLIIEIFRGEPLASVRLGESRSVSRYKDLLVQIYKDYDKMSFSDAAAFMNMSEAYFSRFFKKLSHMTFSRFINIVRVSKAIEKMKQRPDVTMAALMSECGFNTLRNFNRVFKEVTGYPPSRLPAGYVLDMHAFAERSSSEPVER